MPLAAFHTAEMVRALPDDGNRYETVHGELLVAPAPGGFHKRVLTRLVGVLLPYLADGGVEDLLISPADVTFGNDSLVQSDLFVADWTELNRTGRWEDLGRLHLVVEILSPPSLRADRFTKRRLYQEQRIPTYWLVDTDRALAEVWTPDATFPVVVQERLVWRDPRLDNDCVIELPALFRTG